MTGSIPAWLSPAWPTQCSVRECGALEQGTAATGSDVPLDGTSLAPRRLNAAPELSSTHGGAVAAVQAPQGAGRPAPESQGLVPESAVYRVMLRPADASAAAMPRLQALRGTVVIDGQAESLLRRAWRRGAAVLVREAGF